MSFDDTDSTLRNVPTPGFNNGSEIVYAVY